VTEREKAEAVEHALAGERRCTDCGDWRAEPDLESCSRGGLHCSERGPCLARRDGAHAHDRLTSGENAILRVYLDNVIASGRVRRDLVPPNEMAAVDRIDKLHAERRLKVVTSKMSTIEQRRTSDLALRSTFIERSDEVSMVQGDHRVLGFQNIDYGHLGFISYPPVTDIVNDALFATLLALGLKDADAKHVMYAVENDCQIFLTLDTRDILPRRAAIEAACGHMRILRPTELIAELNHMARQDDRQPCVHKGCTGTMIYHEKIKADPQANPPLQPSGMVGGRPDWNYSGWLCDSGDPTHVIWDKP
jgi:hypothetical protein